MPTLRRAEPQDLEIIHDMLSDLEQTELPLEAFRGVFLRNIADPDHLYLVAINEAGLVVGHLSLHTQWLLHHAGRVAEIQEMYVSAEYRGAGIGDHLLNKAIKWAEDIKCVLVEVTANVSRTRTHDFYSAHGFVRTHYKFTLPLASN